MGRRLVRTRSTRRALAEAWALLEEALDARGLQAGEPLTVQVEVDELLLKVELISNEPTGRVVSVQADPAPVSRRRK